MPDADSHRKAMSENSETVLNQPSPADPVGASEIDLSLLRDSLAKTAWERMQANDDALNFGETLRAAMEKQNAKP